MPKSNFSQYIDECDYYSNSNIGTCNTNKISFENNENSELKNENQSITIESNATILQPYKPPSMMTSNGLSNGSSLNIFLSKHTNNSIRRIGEKHDGNKNIFKKTNDGVINSNASVSAINNSVPSPVVIEINDDTFPCLMSTSKLSTANNNNSRGESNTHLKKNKNFKDAICAPKPPLSVTPMPSSASTIYTIKKHTLIPVSNHVPPPFLVKKDSEMIAKKILTKTAVADDGSENENDDECEYRNIQRCQMYDNDSYDSDY